MAKKYQQSNRDNDNISEPGVGSALELLKQDHREVEQLLKAFEEADGGSRQGIADEAIKALEAHTKIEEEVVYPAIREATTEEDLVDEAKEEHHVVAS